MNPESAPFARLTFNDAPKEQPLFVENTHIGHWATSSDPVLSPGKALVHLIGHIKADTDMYIMYILSTTKENTRKPEHVQRQADQIRLETHSGFRLLLANGLVA